ncbi:helix-turn-helix transcriptional regulator [Paenibacillus sp. FSL H8-0317]|uniref:DNA-binding XRE family transcriptional regulator n=1 Tax=Paenibacillus barcinonensis TaxID=198119 RepID=A0A2V4VFB4_PAEBA|nr:helix-turn-helix transcriptional regulator [Paenibacillus barcinonensis]PYE52530.1 DNA-binding XRE family transcriptional regulator [Paenibacillus barcinonensis]QKS59313.1 helix-turn-helix transcriptional regulator [Paenibacillus barcinonensis]QKS59367.1 helix-turn-helix transcriptional regulator [Paenibacillus barcinonensis]
MKKISFAENLKRYREKRGLTKEELGERIGVSGVTIGYWESGRNEPRMGKVDLIARVLDITIDDLLFDLPMFGAELEIHNKEITEDQKRAIELILSLPPEEVKMFNILMERSLDKEDN